MAGRPSLAALAIRVNGLRRGIDPSPRGSTTLTRTQQEHAIVLEGIAELRRQVEKIFTILDNDDETSPEQWFWLTMNRPGTRRTPQRTNRLGRNRPPRPVPRLPRRPDQALLAEPPRSPMGTHLALPALDPAYLDQATSAERRRRLARPLDPRRHPPPQPDHAPMRENPASASPAERSDPGD